MNTKIEKYITNLCIASKRASVDAKLLSHAKRLKILKKIISNLKKDSKLIIRENNIDVKSAQKNNLSDALIDRLLINNKRILTMIDGLKKILTIPDILFQKINKSKQPSGIVVEQMRVPLGVIAMIYESRPNVTIDATGLALKSGNSIILRGGSESINTNILLSKIIKKSLLACNVSPDIVQIINTTDRSAVSKLLKMDDYIDVIIP